MPRTSTSRTEVQRVGRECEVAPAAQPKEAGRAPDRPAVEDPDRDHVEQVEEEAEVRERVQEIRVARLREQIDDERRRAAEDRSGDRDPNGLPRMAACVRDVRTEERDEDRQLRMQPFALRLDEV